MYMNRHLRRSVITKASSWKRNEIYLPSVTFVTETYLIITRMFPNYDTSEKLFFLPAFLKK